MKILVIDSNIVFSGILNTNNANHGLNQPYECGKSPGRGEKLVVI